MGSNSLILFEPSSDQFLLVFLDADVLQVEPAIGGGGEAPNPFRQTVDLLRHPKVHIGQLIVHDSLCLAIEIGRAAQIPALMRLERQFQ